MHVANKALTTSLMEFEMSNKTIEEIERERARLIGPLLRGSPATVAKIHVRMSELKRELDQAKKEAGECRVTKSG